ncbi:hypothetical protein ACFE04_030335 [Oxalis oulophora]
MTCYPNPGSVTICEINGDLVTVDKLSEERANDTYGKIIGMVFSPVTFPALYLLLSIKEMGKPIVVQRPQGGVLHTVPLPLDINYRRISWHKHKRILAFISGQHEVTICDFENSSQTHILANLKQRNVSNIEWRPNAGKVLCVASL